MIPRRQPPAYSPVTAPAIGRAAVQGLGLGADPLQRLERRLAREYAADRVVLCGSGTEALQLAIDVALRRTGTTSVALPAYTCYDVGAAAVAREATIELFDVDPATLGPDLETLARVLERGTRVVVISPLFGVPVDWDAIAALLARYGATGIEDAAQGHGATWRGRPLGSLGPLSVLSFARGKGWSGGSGGALLTRGPDAGHGLDELRLPPRGRSEMRTLHLIVAQWALGRPVLYGLPASLPWLHLGESVYRDAVPPRSMSRAAAAAVEALACAAQQEAAARRENARAMVSRIEGDLVPRIGSDAVAGFLRLPLRVQRGMGGFASPDRARQLGIARSYPKTLADLPAVNRRLSTAGACPGAAELTRTLVTAPTHSLVGPAERDAIIELLRGYRK